jgi:hypothetical protein
MKKTHHDLVLETDLSPGLAYMAAAVRAIPASAGDRDRVDIISRAMRIALEYRFQFRPREADILRRLNFRSSGTNVDLLSGHHYEMACIYGGTYAAMWEADKAQKPWNGHRVVAREPNRSNLLMLTENRIAPGMGILLPGDVADDELYLCRHDGRQVWWCTAFDNEKINICRYELDEGAKHGLGRSGSPAKRIQYSRPEWKALCARSVIADQVLEQASVSAPEARSMPRP